MTEVHKHNEWFRIGDVLVKVDDIDITDKQSLDAISEYDKHQWAWRTDQSELSRLIDELRRLGLRGELTDDKLVRLPMDDSPSPKATCAQ